MKYAPWLLLLAAAPAQANGWPWWTPPICPEDRAEIRRIERLTSLPKCQLDAVIEGERAAYNQRALMQYNRMLPSPLPPLPTPEVAPAGTGHFRAFHR